MKGFTRRLLRKGTPNSSTANASVPASLEVESGSVAATSIVVQSNEESRRVEHGRMFNVLCETYALPADDDEFSRLNKQHIAFVLGVGGLYPNAEIVRAVLAPQEGTQKKILDLGYGTGVWYDISELYKLGLTHLASSPTILLDPPDRTISMAKEFPHAQVVGIDLIDAPATTSTIPSNCTFLKENINLGLSSHYEQYSFVHARLIGSGLQNFRASLEEIQKCLIPGGFLLLTDADFDFYGPDMESYFPVGSEDNPSGSWFTRIIAEFGRAASKFGGDLKGTAQALDEGLWDSPMMDPATCKAASLYWPLGPWKDDEDPSISETLKYAGTLLREDLKELCRGGSAVVMKAGWPKSTVQEWLKKADEELANMNPPLWGRTRFAWGRRRQGLSEPAPALPQIPSQSSSRLGEASSSIVKPYPEFHIYDTKEISLQAQARRNRGKAVPLPPYPA